MPISLCLFNATRWQAFPDLRAAHFELPLSPVIAKGNDEGTPVVVADPLSNEAEVRGMRAAIDDSTYWRWKRGGAYQTGLTDMCMYL